MRATLLRSSTETRSTLRVGPPREALRPTTSFCFRARPEEPEEAGLVPISFSALRKKKRSSSLKENFEDHGGIARARHTKENFCVLFWTGKGRSCAHLQAFLDLAHNLLQRTSEHVVHVPTVRRACFPFLLRHEKRRKEKRNLSRFQKLNQN